MRPLNQEVEQLAQETPTLGAVENAADESGILSDQDETHLASPSDEDPNLGSEGTDLEGPGDFARGEIDVKEQMDRAMAAMDHTLHRPRDPGITPHSMEGNTRDTHSDLPAGHGTAAPTKNKGGSTGAYTDVGAGRSGVTKTTH